MASIAPTSPQLTPNSKIKAMLAAVDDESGSDVPESHSRQIMPSVSASAIVETKKHVAYSKHSATEDETDEEEAPIKPRGRLVSRLNECLAHEEDDAENAGSDSDKENAYTRVKKQLMKKALKPTREGPKQTAKRRRLSSASSSPAGSPNRTRNSKRTATPSPSTTKQPEGAPSPAQVLLSDSDLPNSPVTSSRFQELVAKKRAEREAKEAEEAARKQKRMPHDFSDDSGEGSADGDAEQKLTQHNRPTRKASKKALAEMSRETQRMSRNMQLAHQARTKKKVSKQSLLDRFKFGAAQSGTLSEVKQQSSSTITSSAPASDHEDITRRETPPTSPLLTDSENHSKSQEAVQEIETSHVPSPAALEMHQNELPDMMDILTEPITRLDKGEGKAVELPEPALPVTKTKGKRFEFKQRPIEIHHPKLTSQKIQVESSSDSDLEVLPSSKAKAAKSDVFSRISKVRTQDVRPLQTLRALAHLNSPPGSENRRGKASVSLFHLQASLQQKARQQAAAERKAKIEDLKARGIIVQTAEEREQEQVEVEDLLEKARRENAELREKEKRASNKEKLANGEAIDDSSDDDEDYQEGDEGEQDLELSGSDEEIRDEEDEVGEVIEESDDDQGVGLDDQADESKETGGLIEDEASDDSRDEEDIEADFELEADDEDEEEVPKQQIQRLRRKRMVIDDDEEVDGPAEGPDETTESPVLPKSPVIEVPKIFQAHPGNMPMGMTQAFAATMADSQTQARDSQDGGNRFIAPFDGPPEPVLPTILVEDSLSMVEDTQATHQPGVSQIQETSASNRILLDYSQSQIQYEGMDDVQSQSAATQMSEIPDPTQDAGFVLSSPGPEQRFVSEPPSTVDTVIISSAADSGLPIKKRGRLQRRKVVEQAHEDEQAQDEAQKVTAESKADAFAVMKRKREKAAQREHFNRKKSEAKEMVEEQAQESEDEYAGLGGASDEDSGEEDEDVKAMIDHGEVKVNQRRIAELYA